MRQRIPIFASFLLLTAVCVAQSRLKVADLQGSYQVLIAVGPGKPAVAQDPRTTPPGQMRHFVISGNHWILYDMMTGFEGQVFVTGNTVTLLQTEGATGKLKKPEKMIFTFSKPCTLTSKKAQMNIVFVRTSNKPDVHYSKGGWK